MDQSLEVAKAKDAGILEKLNKVKNAAQIQKHQTKINQQRLEWIEQARKLDAQARRLENELEDVSGQLGLFEGLAEDRRVTDESTADIWFQVSGVRQLLSQVRQRDPCRLRQAPRQVLSLQDLLGSVAAAMSSLGGSFRSQEAELDQTCSRMRRSLRHEFSAEGIWSGARHMEDRCDLSEEEDVLLERIGGESESYEEELGRLNDQVRSELSLVEQELAETRRKCKDWDEQAQFRFLCIKQQFLSRRDLLIDRLSLEFPHLSREQLQAHDTHCDALRFAAQRQTAAFRQWRRERLLLLRRHQDRFEERQRAEETLMARRHCMSEQRERQQELHNRLQAERARNSLRDEENQRANEDMQRQRLAAESERAQNHQKRVQLVKELSRAHMEKKHELKVQHEMELAKQEHRSAEERERRREQNAEIVRMRRQMDELKHQELAQQRSAVEQERREREHRLQQALEKLRVEAPRDPDRLLKVPARAQVEAYCDPLVCVTRGPHAGFDEKRLMTDARYKLSAALQAAGLFGTQAGHEVLARVPAPRPAQPHILSSVFAGGYPG